jgi:hypothetical protein
VNSSDDVFVTGFESDNVLRIKAGNGAIDELVDANGDGLGNVLTSPSSIVVDGNNKVFVVGAESDNGFLITITPPSGLTPEEVTVTLEIDESGVEPGDGGTDAEDPDDELEMPSGVAFNSRNEFFVSGGISNNVFRVRPDPRPARPSTVSQVLDSTGDGEANGLDVGLAIVADSSDNIFVTGVRSNNVLKITPAGVVSEIIDRDGTGSNAGGLLISPHSIAVDRFDNVYVAGLDSNNVLKITPIGTISRIISPQVIPRLPGQTPADVFDAASSVVVDMSNDDVYVAGFNSNNVFRIDGNDGDISEIITSSGNEQGELDAPTSLALDSIGNVYVAGGISDNVFQITPSGDIRLIIDATGDGAGIALDRPERLVVDSADNLYVAGFNSSNVFRVTPALEITVIIDATGDGAGNTLEASTSLTVDSEDNIYVAGIDSDNVFQVTPTGVITEIIDAAGDDTGNEMVRPGRLAVDSNDDVFVSGQISDNVIRITPAPIVP